MEQVKTTVSETTKKRLTEQAARLDLSLFTYVRRVLSAVARGDVRYEEKVESDRKPFFMP
jgi:hypothetical protein